jgi:ribose transport system substrate-binding protein
MKSIEEGFIDGTMAQNPIGHGYISMMLLKLMEEGYEPIDADNYFVQAGHLFVKSR